MCITHNMNMNVIQKIKDKEIDQSYAEEVTFVYDPSQHPRVQAGLNRMSVLSESLKCE